jgi:hypothetical protein
MVQPSDRRYPGAHRGRAVAVDSDSRGGALGFRQTARRERELAAAGLTPKLFYPIRFLQLKLGVSFLVGYHSSGGTRYVNCRKELSFFSAGVHKDYLGSPCRKDDPSLSVVTTHIEDSFLSRAVSYRGLFDVVCLINLDQLQKASDLSDVHKTCRLAPDVIPYASQDGFGRLSVGDSSLLTQQNHEAYKYRDRDPHHTRPPCFV